MHTHLYATPCYAILLSSILVKLTYFFINLLTCLFTYHLLIKSFTHIFYFLTFTLTFTPTLSLTFFFSFLFYF